MEDEPSIADSPHYEINSTELANWIERQGKDHWWSFDSNRLLTGRVFNPGPGEELAAALRFLNRPLLVLDRNQPPKGKGEVINSDHLDALAKRWADYHPFPAGQIPTWASERFFDLCWKGEDEEWRLDEDLRTTETMRADAAAVAGDC